MILKKMLKLSLSVLLVLGVTTACEKDDDTQPENEEKNVDLADLSAGEVQAVIEDNIVNGQSYEAELSDHFSLEITFPDNQVLTLKTESLEEQNYNLASSPNEATLAIESGSYSTISGNLEITGINAVDQTVSGKFALELQWGENQISIPSGAFKSVTYTESTGPENGSFTAKVNGGGWAAESMTSLVNEQVNFLNIFGETANNVDISISINMDDAAEGNTYQLTGNGDYTAAVYESGETMANHFPESGELTITKLDTVNNIIEAEFYFKATSLSSDAVYEVTEGEVSYDGYYYR
jgi:hypothetical protein